MNEQIPIYVISLPDAVKRRAPLIAQLKEYDLNYETLNAVDCRNGIPRDFEQFYCDESTRKSISRSLTPAEVGCALSHQKIYQRIWEEGHDAAIVLEDDAIITNAFAELTMQVIDPDIDLLVLCHRFARVSMKFPKMLNGGSMAYVCKTKPLLTVGYIITNRTADYFIKNSLPLSGPADWPVDLLGINVFAAHPQIVHHSPLEKGGHSYIEHDRIEIVNRTKERYRMERKRGLSRILSKTFFSLGYWKRKVEKLKIRLMYTKIS